jgi:hypothetical protein
MTLNPQQELGLVEYIIGLSERGLAPTREMVQNFATTLAGKHVGRGWVRRFVKRHNVDLLSRYTSAMDKDRHMANSEKKYQLYFDLLHSKIKEYGILPSNMYNMDEKGFLIGVIGSSHRIFSRRAWEKREVTSAVQDGNREWITTVACVGADGVALPPLIIFEAENGNLRDSWVFGITPEYKDQVFVASSPSGWTNNQLGVAWLEHIFNRYTEEKCRRSWRLLILDGHGSHITMEFLDYCNNHKILLAIFPPHSTHTLQPLDVVLFRPLSSNYSKALTQHLHTTQNLVPVKKGDFFPIFWQAWIASMKKDLIQKSFKATGIYPMDPQVVLKRFHHDTSSEDEGPEFDRSIDLSNWREAREFVSSVIKDGAEKQADLIIYSLHRLADQKELVNHENKVLTTALKLTNKHKKKSKKLPIQEIAAGYGGAIVHSPSKIQLARESLAQKKAKEEAEIARKAQSKEAKKANKIYKAQQKIAAAEKRRVDKEARDKKKAEERVQIDARKAARAAAKVAKTATNKRKQASITSPITSRKKQAIRQSGGGASGVGAQEEEPAPQTRVTSRGRNIKVPSKYR